MKPLRLAIVAVQFATYPNPSDVAHILKPAIRRLAKAPGFTAVAIVMLGLGVAMSTAAFSITNAALLRPLPFRDPDQLVRVSTSTTHGFDLQVAPGNAMDVRDFLSDIAEFGIFTIEQKNIGQPGEPPEQHYGLEATDDALQLLGARAELGRIPHSGEGKPRDPPIMMLTDSYWRDHFAADPGVIGKTVRVDTTNCTVIGVLSPEFERVMVWSGIKWMTVFPMYESWRGERSAKWLSVMGRLRPGVSFAYAQTRLRSFSQQLSHDHPKMGGDVLRLTPLGTSYASTQLRFVHWLIVALAVFVLVIACANLGGVQLARAFARHHELATRAALGATRADLVLALAAENAILAIAGTALGVLVSFWTRSLVAQAFGSTAEAFFDGRVLAFAAAAGVLSTLVFGVAPAWLSASSLAQAMKESTRSSTGTRSQSRLKTMLIVGQVSLALVLVSTAASFLLGTRRFLQQDRGWRPESLVTGVFHLTWQEVQRERRDASVAKLMLDKLGAIPGVEDVALTCDLTLSGVIYPTDTIYVEGTAVPAPGHETYSYVSTVTGSFFHTVGIPLREGIVFSDRWRPTDPAVAVVSVSTARRLWPNTSALGKRFRLGGNPAWHEVIGIVEDAQFGATYDLPTATLQIYRPMQEEIAAWNTVVLKTHLSGPALERPVRAAFANINPDIMLVEFGPTARWLANHLEIRPLNASLVAFASAGLVIAMIGLYAVMSQFTQQRKREFGVRIALGAQRHDVMALMLIRGAWLLSVGAIVGIAGSLAVGYLFHRSLPQLPMFGLLGDASVALALIAAGMGACFLPAARAACVNPIEVLRQE